MSLTKTKAPIGAMRKGDWFDLLSKTLFLSGECQHLWNVLWIFQQIVNKSADGIAVCLRGLRHFEISQEEDSDGSFQKKRETEMYRIAVLAQKVPFISWSVCLMHIVERNCLPLRTPFLKIPG